MLLSIALLAAQTIMLPPLTLLPPERGCPTTPHAGGDVVVCGRNDARYRLPLPNERERTGADGPVRGEAGRASVDGTAPCGIFAGQRNCSKADAARHGYGGGRDPITVGGKALRNIFDPDADLGEPTSYPR